jgi:hypothetical protein
MSRYYFGPLSHDSQYETSSTSSSDDDDASQHTETTVANSSLDNDRIDEYEDDDWEDEIYWDDQEFVDSDKQDGQYVLGITYYINGYDIYFSGISAKSFYKFPFQTVINYLYDYSIIRIEKPVVDIIQIRILQDGRYITIRKTYWLRVVQKCWRKYCRERKDIIQKRMKISSLCYRQLTGRWPPECSLSLSCKGILSNC